jgi:uncharacterized protein YkwD
VLCIVALAAPSLPVLGAVLGPDTPMVASARTGAERSRAPVEVGTTVPPPPSEAEALAAEVVRLTNLERAAVGRSTLSVHPAVVAAAVTHSQDQAAQGRISHTGSDGSNTGTRLTRSGFTWRTWGENVAAGQRTASDVVAAWMGSAGHRANMLSSSFTTIGIGVVTSPDGRRYWTMVLAA